MSRSETRHGAQCQETWRESHKVLLQMQDLQPSVTEMGIDVHSYAQMPECQVGMSHLWKKI